MNKNKNTNLAEKIFEKDITYVILIFFM